MFIEGRRTPMTSEVSLWEWVYSEMTWQWMTVRNQQTMEHAACFENKIVLNQPCPFVYVLSMSACTLTGRVRVVEIKMVGLGKMELFAVLPFTEKVC